MEHFIWNINPTLLHLGPLQLRWYGLLFVGSFFLGLMILQWVYKREDKNTDELDNFLIYVLIGTVIGARLMHCFAYEPAFYLSHPLEIFKVWKGGLASHGGLIGVVTALYIFCRHYQQSFWWLLARLTMPGALTAAFVRFGNFFNSEILGLPSDKPWAIIFERIDMIPRHPVQLYEAGAYLVLLLILVSLYKKISPLFFTKLAPGIFLTYMFIARFLLEYTKTRQADYATSLPFTTGQMLSVPFIILGIAWIVWAIKNRATK
ncbi:Prolipoprotein diacylglyceryl transferase [hydrothermal vent metagenome]|uniref:Prolipoprotein diacylglyceryl transferase n=1 Tax=hydrothermal vent metagenome TaxID=652676 RepID=A0A1W1CKL7_9ZZZZ